MLFDYIGFIPASDHAMTTPPFEFVNSARAYAYADHRGLAWVQECDHCPTAHPPGASYTTPDTGSVAPWWNGDPARLDFLGVIGMNVTGGDDSTRTAKVSQTLSTPGGAIGPPYYGPRTLVVTGLAIAANDCGLQSGISWLQLNWLNVLTDTCSPPAITYYECCPADGTSTGERRRFREVRVTDGPEFTRVVRNMPSGGAFATFETTFVCGDPDEYGPSGPTFTLDWTTEAMASAA